MSLFWAWANAQPHYASTDLLRSSPRSDQGNGFPHISVELVHPQRGAVTRPGYASVYMYCCARNNVNSCKEQTMICSDLNQLQRPCSPPYVHVCDPNLIRRPPPYRCSKANSLVIRKSSRNLILETATAIQRPRDHPASPNTPDESSRSSIVQSTFHRRGRTFHG